jgi:hypothetical protein
MRPETSERDVSRVARVLSAVGLAVILAGWVCFIFGSYDALSVDGAALAAAPLSFAGPKEGYVPPEILSRGFVFTFLPDRLVSAFCSACPRLAWRLGNGDMQARVAESLSRQVQHGMSYEQVCSIFGSWPPLSRLPNGLTVSASFPATPDGGNVGIMVYFISNGVSHGAVWD